MNRKILLFLLLFSGSIFTFGIFAQEKEISLQEVNEDDLGNVTDAFQENFFEALKQKGIENYEKAVQALKQCERIEPDNPVVHFEMGKNYKFLKNYDAAVESLQKANRLKPNQEWVLVELMEVYYLKQDFQPAILVAKNLIPFNTKYYNNLADIYLRSQKYDELLTLLDKLDADYGINEYRLGLRQQIYSLTNNTPAQIQTLKAAIKANPENEMNFLNLVFVYSEQGMEKEAFEAAEEMRKNFPTSNVVHLALYKFYLNSNNTPGALASMKTVLKAEEIDPESKFKVLNDFLKFVNENEEYEDELEEVISIFADSEGNPGVYQKLGEYFLVKGQKEQALKYFQLGLYQDLDNFELIKNTLLLQMDLSQFKEAAALSEKALEIFPGQPLLYLINGTALNREKEYKKAEQILTFGLDYVIENKKMELDFFEQLIMSYSGLENEGKVLEFREKTREINKTFN